MTGALAAPARPHPSRTLVLVLLALVCVPYAIGLGEPPLWDANEPLYAQPPKEALETGDWLAPPWNGGPAMSFVHPPLSAWVTIPSYALFGVSPLSERIPMALAAIATILATFSIGRAIAGTRGGLVAAAALSGTARYWLFARQLSGDVLLVACLTGAFALSLRALVSGGREGRGRLLGGYALVGIGVLAKGPVIVVLFLAPFLLAARLARPRVPWRALRPVAFGGIVLALGAPWFVYMTERFGTEYLTVYFGHHHARRAMTDEAGARPWWYHVVGLLGDAQPWILFVPFAVRRAARMRERDPARLLAWAAAACPLLLFSIPNGKRSVYLLPTYPALAAALAPFLLESWDGLHRRLARAGALLLAAGASACVALLLVGATRVPAEIAAGSRVYVGICALAALASLVVARRASGRLLVALTVGTTWCLLVASALLLPILGRFMPVPRLAATLRAHAGPSDPAIVYRTGGLHSLMYYADRRTSVVPSVPELVAAIPEDGRAFFVGSADAVAELGAGDRLAVRELDRAPWFRFHFARNIRGRGGSTKDLVLVELRRRTSPRPDAPEEEGDPVRSPDGR